MTMKARPLNASRSGVTGSALAGFRIVLTLLAGLALMLSALLFGVVAAAVAMLWGLFRRRRARMAHFGWRGARTRPGASATPGDVIDVEMRKIASPDRPSPHQDA